MKKSIWLSILLICTSSTVSLKAISKQIISNVRPLYSCSKINVTEIEYSSNATVLTFGLTDLSIKQLSVGQDIMIVDDHGVQHKAVEAIGIKFDSLYQPKPDSKMHFKIKFDPVATSNLALDIIENGRITILGLHDEECTLSILQAHEQNSISGLQTEPIGAREVIVEGMIHGYDNFTSSTKVAIQYVPPTGIGNPSQNYTDIDSDGHFMTKLVMYNPQIVYIYTINMPDNNRVEGKVYIKPGEKVHIDLYKDKGIERNNADNSMDISRLRQFPIFVPNSQYRLNLYNGRITNPSNGVSTDYTSFSIMNYEEQRNKLATDYKEALKCAEYIVWHYQLTSIEAVIYTIQVHEAFCSLLLSTEISAGNRYEEAQTNEEKRQYAPSATYEAYGFLKLVPQDETAFSLINTNIPEMIPSLKPMKDCYDQVAMDDPKWCLKVLQLQIDILYKMTEWKEESFITQMTMVELARHLSIFFEDQFEISGNDMCRWLQEQLLDPYCRSLLVALIHNSSD